MVVTRILLLHGHECTVCKANVRDPFIHFVSNDLPRWVKIPGLECRAPKTTARVYVVGCSPPPPGIRRRDPAAATVARVMLLLLLLLLLRLLQSVLLILHPPPLNLLTLFATAGVVRPALARSLTMVHATPTPIPAAAVRIPTTTASPGELGRRVPVHSAAAAIRVAANATPLAANTRRALVYTTIISTAGLHNGPRGLPQRNTHVSGTGRAQNNSVYVVGSLTKCAFTLRFTTRES